MWWADEAPFAIGEDLAADGAGGVLDEDEIVLRGNALQRGDVAGHAELMHGEDGLGLRRDGLDDALRCDVKRRGFDIDHDRHGARVSHGIDGGDVAMADGDDLIAWQYTRDE